MPLTVTHAYVNPTADEGDPNKTGPDEWNAAHTLSGALPVANGGTGQTTEAEALGEMIQALTADASPDATADYVVTYDASADTGKKVLISTLPIREKLAADRVYYVRSDGNDSNTGLVNNAGGAWLTLNHASSWITGQLDFSSDPGTEEGFTVTVNIGAGTFDGCETFGPMPQQFGVITFSGAGQASTTIITGNSFYAFTCEGDVRLLVQNLKVDTTTGGGFGQPFLAERGEIGVQDVTVVTQPNDDVFYSADSGLLQLFGTITISAAAGCGSVLRADDHGRVQQFSNITVTGTPAWGTAFAVADRLGLIDNKFGGATAITGSATGKRYQLTGNSVIDTAGSGSTFYPGNAAGTAASGGQYI